MKLAVDHEEIEFNQNPKSLIRYPDFVSHQKTTRLIIIIIGIIITIIIIKKKKTLDEK